MRVKYFVTVKKFCPRATQVIFEFVLSVKLLSQLKSMHDFLIMFPNILLKNLLHCYYYVPFYFKIIALSNVFFILLLLSDFENAYANTLFPIFYQMILDFNITMSDVPNCTGGGGNLLSGWTCSGVLGKALPFHCLRSAVPGRGVRVVLCGDSDHHNHQPGATLTVVQ